METARNTDTLPVLPLTHRRRAAPDGGHPRARDRRGQGRGRRGAGRRPAGAPARAPHRARLRPCRHGGQDRERRRLCPAASGPSSCAACSGPVIGTAVLGTADGPRALGAGRAGRRGRAGAERAHELARRVPRRRRELLEQPGCRPGGRVVARHRPIPAPWPTPPATGPTSSFERKVELLETVDVEARLEQVLAWAKETLAELS